MAEETGPLIRLAANETERREALSLALRPLDPGARGPLLDTLAATPPQGLGPLDALFVAIEAGGIAAATWAQPSPGRAAALWPPEWAGRRPVGAEAVEAALIEAAVTACDTSGVAMVQALFENADDPRAEALARAGFEKIAELDYLGRTIPGAPTRAAETVLNFEPFSQQHHARLKRLLQQTYVGSLDCPGLDALRDLEDMLAGYRATGRYDPQHWLIASDLDGQDVGVVLVSEHPDADQAELIYMGVAHEARGRGLGARLVDQAVRVSQAMGVEHLMAAVDRANVPARRVYERAAFSRWAQRQVYVRGRLRG